MQWFNVTSKYLISFFLGKNGSQVTFGTGIVVGGVVAGSGGVIIVVGIMVPGDGCGREGVAVPGGVAGVEITGRETVPAAGGGEGTGMLTCAGGANGIPAGVELTAGPEGVPAVPELTGTPEPPPTLAGDIVVVWKGVVPEAGVKTAT